MIYEITEENINELKEHLSYHIETKHLERSKKRRKI